MLEWWGRRHFICGRIRGAGCNVRTRGIVTCWHMYRASREALELLEDVLVFEVRELFLDFSQRLLRALLWKGNYGKEDEASTPLRDDTAAHDGLSSDLGNCTKETSRR